MSIPRLLLAAFVGLPLMTGLHAAALRWEETMVEKVAAPTDREVRAEYRFHNATNRTITIHSVATSCGCTTATMDQATYRPGEAGKIDVTFHVGSQTGRVEKFIYVRTDTSPQSDADELMLRVNVESYASLTPTAVIWSVDNPTVTKRIACRALTSADVRLIEVRADDPAINVRAETVRAGKIYYVYATPTSTAQPIDTTIRLKFATSDGHQRDFDVPAIVLTPIHPKVAR